MKSLVKSTIFAGLTALVLSVGGIALAQAAVPTPPTDLNSAVNDLGLLVQLGKAGSWVAFSLVVSQVLIFVVKSFGPTSGVMNAWGSMIVTVLSAVAGLLASLVGGLPLTQALLVVLATGLPKLLNDMKAEWATLQADKAAAAVPPAAK